MVELIVGSKGKGKTKELLDRAARAIKSANGNVVYIDRSAQHMYELSNKIRLINISRFPINSEEGYLGFLCGVISQDHDLEYLFLDGFLTVSNLVGGDISGIISKIAALSDVYGVNFVISVSMDVEDIPESCKQYIAVAL